MDQEAFIYHVPHNHFRISKSGEVYQNGGDWYYMYTSIGEVRIPEETIRRLINSSITPDQLEAEGKKINPTFKLSGSLILNRGVTLGKAIVYSKDDGKPIDNGEEDELLNQYEELSTNIEDNINNLNNQLIELNSINKKILSNKRKKKNDKK